MTETASETETGSDTETPTDTGTDAGSDTDAGIETPTIKVAAALITDDDGRLLLVRKAGTTVFMQPGGKYEPGETGAQTLVRELHEELSLTISTDALESLGTFIAPAANEAGMLVEAEVFRATIAESTGELVAGAEIEELRWAHPDEFDGLAIAPLVTKHMLDLLS